jgi:hypothetical protein
MIWLLTEVGCQGFRGNGISHLALPAAGILQVDQGNCSVVSDEPKCMDKLNGLLQFGVYEVLSKVSTSKAERRVL